MRRWLGIGGGCTSVSSTFWALAIALASLGLISSPGASAAQGTVTAHKKYGYPYAKAPDCTEFGSNRGCVLDKWLFYQGQCTSWTAHRLNQRSKIPFSNYYKGRHWGNASSWGRVARQAKIAVNGKPAVGAVAWYSSGHVGYVEKTSPHVVISEMNYDFHNGFRVVQIAPGRHWPTGFIHFKDLKNGSGGGHSPPAHNPRGHLNKVSSPAEGAIRTAGWAFDPDKKTSQVTIHVYVGGKAHSKGTKGYSIGKASKTRKDVAKAFKGVGAKHGFDKTVKTSKRGRQSVCVYAVNIGAGATTLLGCKKVSIKAKQRFKRPTVKGTYTPLSGDFNGDGRSDVFWYGPGDSHDSLWYGRSEVGEFTAAAVNVKGTYTPLTGDFNGDGRSDVFWYGPGDSHDSLWYGRSEVGEFTAAAVNVKGTYTPLSGDFNGDGRSDVFWYGPGDSHDSLWYGRPNVGDFKTAVPITVKGFYTPITGDFNGDGRSDVFWYGPGDSRDSLWYGQAQLGSFLQPS